jgi:hypothetical protein
VSDNREGYLAFVGPFAFCAFVGLLTTMGDWGKVLLGACLAGWVVYIFVAWANDPHGPGPSGPDGRP